MTRSLPKATLCSTLAIATALLAAPRPAAAQFIGTVISQTGANAHQLGNGQMQINVNSPQAVINWSATGGATNGIVTFQQSGAIANYQGNGSFAVLNRVYPTVLGSGILIDGIINTSINGQNGGGTVFFYSPNGIVIGQNAAINVGSLGLTTSNILDDGNGNWLSGFGNGSMTVQFQQSSPTGYVRIDPNATVGVFGQSNYIALVAPKIQLQGTIKTDGVAALVAAEAATLTINDNGLWDIVVDSGTTDAQGIYMSGAIARNTAAVGYDHTAYLVSVAKNDAMTMLFGAGTNLGFEVAGSVGVEDNAIVLSAGENIHGGVAAHGNTPGGSNINFTGGTVTSNLRASATGSIDINSDSAAVQMRRNVALAGSAVSVRATNNSVTIGGNLSATADRYGSAGQSVTGGNITLQALNGKTLGIAGNADLSAIGFGGGGGGEGQAAGSGTGGNILVQAYNGGTLNVAGTLTANADGEGGNQYYYGAPAGDGHGGTVKLLANGGNSHVTAGATELWASGYGGSYGECSECSVMGGDGFGGQIDVNGATGSGNALTLASLGMFASGYGGFGDAGGGDGRGGQSYLASADGATVTINGDFYNRADGYGGGATGGGSGGSGLGGSAGISSFGGGGGQISLLGNGESFAFVSAEGHGGEAYGSGDGGNAAGGSASLNAPGAALTVANQIYVSALASAGGATSGDGGNAVGGTALAKANGQTNILVRAYGVGGNGASGGDGTGGQAIFEADSANFSSTGGATLEAYGTGGSASGAGGTGGVGQGGNVALNNLGRSISIGAATLMSAYGQGGNSAAGAGGAGIGGDVQFYSTGGTTSFGSSVTQDAHGTGGNGIGGGNGVGGWARFYGTGGTVTFNGAVSGNASGTGGSGGSGTGGSGAGGRARLNANGANYHLLTTLNLNTNSFGGAGAVGGNASAQLIGEGETNSAIFANDGGTILIDGASTLRSNATGGNGTAGNGGNATAGRTGVEIGGTGTATVTLGATTLRANATGGNAGAGGTGGSATGGDSSLWVANSSSGTNKLTVASATLNALATGGNGGAGVNGATGGNGGAGGDATGGGTYAVAGAGNGELNVPTLQMYAYASGGAGGAGGTGSAGKGGNGGAGGDAQGGVMIAGIVSGADTPTTAGKATFGTLYGFADSYGGNGGNGGSGTTGQGNGGDGGDALTSFHQIMARGGTLTIGSADIPTDSIGGNGGAGAISGQGGNAYTAEIFLIFTNRQNGAMTGASVDIGAFTGRTTAHRSLTGGGLSIAQGGTQLLVKNSAVHFGSYDGQVNAMDGWDPTSQPDPIRIIGGSVTVTGAFNSHTANRGSVVLDNGTLTAGSVTLDAANFVHDATYAPPAAIGLIRAGTIDIASGQDIILDTRLDSGGDLSLYASGLISLGDLTAGGNIDVDAGSTITLGDIDSGGWANLFAGGAIDVGSILAGDDAHIISYLGGLDADDIAAGGNVDIDTDGNITIGNILAGGLVSFDVGGSLTGGNVTAGHQIGGEVEGALKLGNLTAGPSDSADGFSVGMASATSILVGHVTGTGSVGFATLGPITTGTISAGDDVMVLASGDMDFGPITAGASGRIYLADSSMFIAAGGAGDGEFNPELVFVAAPVATGGSITVHGAINGGSLQAAAGTNFTSGTIDTSGLLMVSAGGNIATGDVHAGDSIGFEAGDITANVPGSILVGNVTAGQSIDFTAGGSIGGGNFTAGDSVRTRSGGHLTLANVSAGLVNPSSAEGAAHSVALQSDGTITTGTIGALGSVGLAAAGAIQAGSINAGGIFLALGGGSMNFGPINAGGDAYLGNYAMLEGGELDDVDVAAWLALTPAASGGAITVGGSIGAASLKAAAGGNFTSGAITTSGGQSIASGGAVTTGVLTAGGGIGIGAVGAISLPSASAGGSIDLDSASGTIDGGGLTAGDTVAVKAAGNIHLDAISAGLFNPSEAVGAEYNVAINSGGTITTGNIAAARNIGVSAVGDIATGSINAGEAFLGLGGANMSFGAITAGGPTYLANRSMMALGGDLANSFNPAPILAATPVASGGSIIVGGPIDTGSLQAAAGTSFASGAINSGGALFVKAGTTIDTGAATAGGDLDMGAAGNITIGGAIDAGGHADLASTGGAISLGALRADQYANFEAGGTISGSTVSAGDEISVWGGQGVTLTNLDAGINAPSSAVGATYTIGVGSAQGVTLGTLSAAGGVGLAAGGALSVGTIQSGGDVLAMVGGNASFGGIRGSGTGRVAIGGYGLLTVGGGHSNFSPGPVFAAFDAGTATATGGSVQIGGPVSAGRLDVLAGTDLATAAVNAGVVRARAGGMATINGQWTVASTRLASNDITIGSGGGISGQSITLLSTNTTQMLVGGGLSGAGYLLDGAEFGRLSAPNMVIAGTSAAGAALDLVVGDLALQGRGGSSLFIGVLNPAFDAIDGAMRVIGHVTGTNLASNDVLAFGAGRIEVDAGTASIILSGSAHGLGGELDFVTQRLHVASAAILGKLSADLNYAYRDYDLQTPTGAGAPDGIVRADQIYVELTNPGGQQAAAVTPQAAAPYSVLFQNSGSAGTRAGFVANYAEIVSPSGAAPGSIDMVVNGQVYDDTGTLLTGAKVRDALMEGDDPARFTASSTINGCAVGGGACIALTPPPPPPPPYDPGPPIADHIILFTDIGMDSLLFGNEETIEDNQEEGGADSASSPIQPPTPLFDTRPLESSGETDEPVSGGGNPALIGSGISPAGAAQADESEEEKKKKEQK